MATLQPLHTALIVLATANSLALCVVHPTRSLAQTPCEESPTTCAERLDPETARGLGLGLGLRAATLATSALAYNPAALSNGKLYHAEGSADYLDDVDTFALGAAIAESHPSQVSAGVAARGFLSGDDGGYHGWDGRIALGVPVSDQFSLGVAGRYMSVGTEVRDENTGELNDVELTEGFSFDASLRFAIGQAVQVSAMAYNFFGADSPLRPRLAGLSMAFVPTPKLAIGVDALFDLDTFSTTEKTLGAAAELLLGKYFPVRAGYVWDDPRDLHFVTFGLGYTSPTAAVDLGVRQGVIGHHNTRILTSLRLSVY